MLKVKYSVLLSMENAYLPLMVIEFPKLLRGQEALAKKSSYQLLRKPPFLITLVCSKKKSEASRYENYGITLDTKDSENEEQIF